MVNVFVELSKYTLLTLMVLYALLSLRMSLSREEKGGIFWQRVLIVLMEALGFVVLYLKTWKETVLALGLCILVFFTLLQGLYRVLYPRSSMRLLNHTCMLLGIGLLILYL